MNHSLWLNRIFLKKIMVQGKSNYLILYHLQVLSPEINDAQSIDDECL